MTGNNRATEYRFDRGAVFQHERTSEGFLRVHMRIARTGELRYQNADGSDRVEIVTPEVLFNKDSIDSFKMVPITSPHPPVMVDSSNARQYQRGMTGNIATIDQPTPGRQLSVDNSFLGIVGTVTDQQLIDSIESGKTKQVSCGYTCQVQPRTDGKFEQINRRGNHIAIVEAGRAGPEVGVNLDAAEEVAIAYQVDAMPLPEKNSTQAESAYSGGTPRQATFQEVDSSVQSQKEKMTTETKPSITLRIDDNTSVQVPPELHAHLSRRLDADAAKMKDADTSIAALTKQVKDLSDRLSAIEKDEDSEKADTKKGDMNSPDDKEMDTDDTPEEKKEAKGKMDALGFKKIIDLCKDYATVSARADQLEEDRTKRLDADTVRSLVRQRRELERKADGLLPADFNLDEASDRSLMEAVISAHSSLKKFDDKSDDYVASRFDAVCESVQKQDSTIPLRQAANSTVPIKDDLEQKVDAAVSARQAYINRITKRSA